MSRRRHDASDWDGDLAGMWMGDRQIPPPRRPGKGPVPWLILSAACAIGIIMVTGYAPVIRSLLPIALGLLVAGLGLKVIGRGVVQSRFLTAPWIIIMALAAALAAYFFLAPDIDSYSLSRYLPRAVVDFFR
jgi:hypothetical protein